MAELEEEKKDGFIVDSAKGIAQGIVEAVNETIEFGQDVVGAVDNTASSITEKVTGGSRIYKTDEGLKFGSRDEMNADFDAEGTKAKSMSDVLQTEINFEGFGKKRDRGVGQVIQTLSQFIGSLVGAGKLTKWKNGKVIGGMGNGFIVGAVAFDPYEANLFKALKDSKYEIIIPHITEALENKEGGNKWENRLKNAVVESGLGGVADASIVLVTRYLKLRRKAKIEERGYGKVLNKTQKELTDAELELEDALEALKGDQNKTGIFNKKGTQFRASDGTVFDTATSKQLEKPDVDAEFGSIDAISNFTKAQIDEISEPANWANFSKLSDNELDAFWKRKSFLARKDNLLEDASARTAGTPLENVAKEVEVKGTDEIVIHQPKVSDEVPTTKLDLGFDVNDLPSFSGVKGATSDLPQFKVNVDDASIIGGARQAPKVAVNNTDEIPVSGTKEVVIPKPEVFDKPPEFPVINTLPYKSKLKIDVNQLAETVKASKRFNPTGKMDIDDVINKIKENNPITGYMNPKGLDTTDNIVSTANIIADSLDDAGVRKAMGFDKVKTEEKVFNEGLAEFADLTGKSIDAFKRSAQKPFKNVKDANKALIKNKLIVRYSLDEVDRLADEITKLGDNVDTLLEKQLVAMMELATDAITYTKATSREIARGLQAGNIKIGDRLTDEAMSKLAKWGGSAKVKNLAKQLQDLKGNNVGKAKLMKEAQKNKFWKMTSEIWINSILSGFKTAAINVTSNTYNLVARPAIRMGGAILSGNSKMIEQSAREYIHIVSEVMDSLTYMTPLIKSSGESAVQQAVRTLKSENGILDKATKFDFDMDTSFKGNWRMDLLGIAVRAPSRFLKAQDEFAKQMSFRSHLKAMIYTDARRMKQIDFENLGYANKNDFITSELNKATINKEMLANDWETKVAYGRIPNDPKIKDAWIKDNLGLANSDSHYAVKALEEARESTFTTPLREGLGKNVQGIVQKHPALRMVMPFVTTPMNILRTAFERTPIVGLATRGNLKKFLYGTPEEKALVRGNQLYGSLMVFAAYNYASSGKITGGGPSYMVDPAKAKLWNASPDWQPYSINAGTDKNPNWIELKRLDPHGFYFGVIGDVYEMMEYTQSDDPDLYEALALVSASIANNITSKTWMAGLNEINLIASGQAKPWEIKKIINSRISQFVPYSAMGMQLNQSQFDEQREIRGFVDNIKARIYQPMGKALNLDFEGLPVKHDWLTGESVDSPDYMLGYIRAKKLDNDEIPAGKVYEELRKLDHTFNGPSRRIDEVLLDGDTYQRYNELVGTLKIDGKTLIQELTQVIDSEEYDKEAKNISYNAVETKNSHRVKKINARIQRYKQRAQQMLFNEYPTLREIIRSNKKTRKLQSIGDPSVSDENIIKEFSLK